MPQQEPPNDEEMDDEDGEEGSEEPPSAAGDGGEVDEEMDEEEQETVEPVKSIDCDMQKAFGGEYMNATDDRGVDRLSKRDFRWQNVHSPRNRQQKKLC